MKRFRIGNDISVTWNVVKGDQAVDFSSKSVSVYLTNPKGRELVNAEDVTISGNMVSFVLPGLDQKVLGKYTITVDARYSEGGRYLIQDKCNAFELVGRSCAECDEPEDINYSILL